LNNIKPDEIIKETKITNKKSKMAIYLRIILLRR